MKVIPLEESVLTLPELAELAQAGPVILTRRGKPLAAVNALERSDWEAIALNSNPRFQELIAESRRSYREQGGIQLEDLQKELGVAKKSRSRRKKA